MATKKSRMAIAFLLMLTMVSFFSLPASVFADENDGIETQVLENTVVENTINGIMLHVGYGGIAIVGHEEYVSGDYVLSAVSGSAIKAYSNAGYVAAGSNIYTVSDSSNQTINVEFTPENDVYGIPYYVTDGYFSGYNANGTDITTGHDPKGDALAATMTATPSTSEYALGATANIALNVTVTDGDKSNNKLNEVDFYENGLRKQTFPNSPDSNAVIYTTTIPALESALTGAGFVLTTDDTYKIYTKTLNYDLVDRYNSDGAASILAKAEAKLVVKIIKPINLWVASDDFAEVYIDGKVAPTDSKYDKAYTYSKDVSDDTFVAAKAWDTDGTANIAGFKLVLKKNNDKGYLSTNADWYYYNKFTDFKGTEPGNDSNGNIWYQKGYKANASDWSKVTSFTLAQAPEPRAWAPDGNFPDANAYWIWSPNYNVGEGTPSSIKIDSPVYLRSEAPAQIPTTGTITVNKDVIGSDGTDVTDATPFNFTYQLITSEINAAAVAGGTVQEGTPTAITLPFGTYKFTEITPLDKYTDITTGGSVTVTISESNGSAEVLFVNQLKASTPVDPGTPERQTTRRTTTTVAVEPTPAGPAPTPEVIIPVIEDQAPGAPVELPKTGGFDASFLYGLGALLAGSGILLKRRKK